MKPKPPPKACANGHGMLTTETKCPLCGEKETSTKEKA